MSSLLTGCWQWSSSPCSTAIAVLGPSWLPREGNGILQNGHYSVVVTTDLGPERGYPEEVLSLTSLEEGRANLISEPVSPFPALQCCAGMTVVILYRWPT